MKTSAGVLLVAGALLFAGPAYPQAFPNTPPPPPPPKEPPPEAPKPLETPRVQEPKPLAKAPDKPKPAPAQANSPLTGAAGSGSNPYGLQVGNGDGSVIGGSGGGGGTGSNFGFYAAMLQSQVQSALKRDEKTRTGRFHVSVKVWLGPAGQVTRTQLTSSSGDPAMDSTLTRVIGGLSLGEAPPAGMPQPIHLRIGAEPG